MIASYGIDSDVKIWLCQTPDETIRVNNSDTRCNKISNKAILKAQRGLFEKHKTTIKSYIPKTDTPFSIIEILDKVLELSLLKVYIYCTIYIYS